MISLVRWPILAGLAIALLAIVYRYGRARVLPKWEWISWGAATATALWLIGSIAFSFYVSEFGSYDRTYGSLGAVIVLLLWFYMTAYVILIGAVLNAETERLAARQGSAPPRPAGGEPCGLNRRFVPLLRDDGCGNCRAKNHASASDGAEKRGLHPVHARLTNTRYAGDLLWDRTLVLEPLFRPCIIAHTECRLALI